MEKQREDKQRKAKKFHQHWITNECAVRGLLMGTHGGPGLETGHRTLSHSHTHTNGRAPNTQSLYYPEAEHHELQGYTSMLIGWGV